MRIRKEMKLFFTGLMVAMGIKKPPCIINPMGLLLLAFLNAMIRIQTRIHALLRSTDVPRQAIHACLEKSLL